jgi:hypothetical protein
MEIDALQQLISEDVKVQGQIMCDGFSFFSHGLQNRRRSCCRSRRQRR